MCCHEWFSVEASAGARGTSGRDSRAPWAPDTFRPRDPAGAGRHCGPHRRGSVAPERAIGFHTVVRGHGRGNVDTEIDGVRFEGVTYNPAARDGSLRRLNQRFVSLGGRTPILARRRCGHHLAGSRFGTETAWFTSGCLPHRHGCRLGCGHGHTLWEAPMVDRGRTLWACCCAREPHRAMEAEHVMVADLGDLRRKWSTHRWSRAC